MNSKEREQLANQLQLVKDMDDEVARYQEEDRMLARRPLYFSGRATTIDNDNNNINQSSHLTS